MCTTTPILAYADLGKPFKLHTDASVLGLGAVLYQIQDGVEKVISHASRSLTKSETKCLVHNLEFLCLKWHHVHNMSAYEGTQVTNMFQRGLEFVTALFQKY